MSLKEWFGKGPKGDWVDIGAPKKGGKFQPCGRKSAKKSKRKYPKCVPRSKAQGVGGKPTNVRTFAKKRKTKKAKKL